MPQHSDDGGCWYPAPDDSSNIGEVLQMEWQWGYLEGKPKLSPPLLYARMVEAKRL